jgi:hypothetical protein
MGSLGLHYCLRSLPRCRLLVSHRPLRSTNIVLLTLPIDVSMPVVAVVKACLLDMVQVGLLTNGVTNNPTTTISHITEALRRHRTAPLCRTNSILVIHSIGMMDTMDSKTVSSFNLQRILMLVSTVASRSISHHQTNMETESSDDLEDTEGMKESKD